MLFCGAGFFLFLAEEEEEVETGLGGVVDRSRGLFVCLEDVGDWVLREKKGGL